MSQPPQRPWPRITIRVDPGLDPDDPVRIDTQPDRVDVRAHPVCIDEDAAADMTDTIADNMERGLWGVGQAGGTWSPIVFRAVEQLDAPVLILDEDDGVIAVLGRKPGFTDTGAEWFTRRVGEHMDTGFWNRKTGGA